MPIQVLPPQLANQIAAGEVVERPASVVKELVENSLDAGATRIDIDIERGGAKLIRIRDNGSGIKKDELALALARHATSKIASLDDLEAIISLGFRGEALASISSVARLTLTSRTAEQQEAWQAYAEGRDQAVTVKPAAHPVGTTLEVLDLFYNTPARRKFMRTEKTEFGHIDEVVRRIALARFDVTINLSHNGKVMRQYRAVAQDGQRERRLGTICGAAFLEHALAIEWQHGDLTLRGWVADPLHTTPALAEIQYCYVNGRMMRDRLINHAIRQACEDKLGADQQPAFVLYLEIDPHQVDVNVHPAKHEVRFHQSRLVHDFIYQGVLSVLQQQLDAPLAEKDDPPARARCRRTASPREATSLRGQRKRGSLRPASASRHRVSLRPPAANRAARAGRMRSRVTRSSRERFIVNCSTRQRRKASVAASGGGRVGRSQSELWQSVDDCWRRLRAAGARGRSGAAVVDRCRALAAPGAVDPGSGGGMCSAAADPAAVKSYGRGKTGAGRRSAGAGAARDRCAYRCPARDGARGPFTLKTTKFTNLDS